MTMADDLHISMLATPAAAGLARTLVEQRLHKWGHSLICDDALLITSELVANTAQETPCREIVFRLCREPAGVLIAVWDSSDRPPAPVAVAETTLDDLDLSEEAWDDNGGRGLLIVAALASECGCAREPTGGKWVYARLLT